MIWASLLHLSYNMWLDREAPELPKMRYISYKPYLRFERSLWDDLLVASQAAGINMIIMDLGDGVKYQSHPEIAVEGAWSVDDLRRELAKMRKMGLEPVPKLNFSATHDAWLGPYARMLSTPKYYDVCRDLIREVIEIYHTPRLFHLGMDEESYKHQIHQGYVVMRQYDLWWNDFFFLLNEVEKQGVRAWIWSDYVWEYPQMFWERMPRSVLQSNWYYNKDFRGDIKEVRAYLELDAQGYEQVPTFSNYSDDTNSEGTVRFCKANLDHARVAGFMTAPWKPTLEEVRGDHMRAIQQLAQAKKVWEQT